MAYVLDLNGSHQYTMELTLQDTERTTLRIGLPTEAMAQEVQNIIPDLRKLEKGDEESIGIIYDLAARLISRNRNFIKVTAEDLRKKYNMDLESAIVFFIAYIDFLNKVQSEKN